LIVAFMALIEAAAGAAGAAGAGLGAGAAAGGLGAGAALPASAGAGAAGAAGPPMGLDRPAAAAMAARARARGGRDGRRAPLRGCGLDRGLVVVVFQHVGQAVRTRARRRRGAVGAGFLLLVLAVLFLVGVDDVFEARVVGAVTRHGLVLRAAVRRGGAVGGASRRHNPCA